MPIDLSDKKNIQDAVVTVMGLGRFKHGSGIGAAKWLLRHGAQLVITDLKDQEELKDSVDEIMSWYTKYKEEFSDRNIYKPLFVLGEHREEHFQDVDLVVQNPGVPRESKFVQLAKENGITIESDISLFYRYCPFPIYSITGTRGKSTTTSLLGEMLKHVDEKTVIAGNIQRSPLEDLDWLLEEKESVPIVLELSSWLLESLAHYGRSSDIAILTNAYRDHLDRYDSFEHYIAAKELIFKYQTPEQFAIVNWDNEVTRPIGERTTGKTYWFSLKPFEQGQEGAYLKGTELRVNIGGDDHLVCTTDDIYLNGEHNYANALAAICAAHIAKVPHDAIKKAVGSFKGLEGRQEYIDEKKGMTWINDTTATSPEGAIAAMNRYKDEDKEIVLLAGGSAKGLNYEAFGEKVRETCKQVILFDGTVTHEMAKAIGATVPMVTVKSMPEAVAKAVELGDEGDVVLLSPAAASFGMFKNEFDRGTQFVDEVVKLTDN